MGLPIVQGTRPNAEDFNLFQPKAHDGANVADYLDSMRPMTALVQLDEYSGAANCVRMIVSENVLFYKRDDNDITSASNPDGSVRIDQLGRRWKRLQGDVTQAVEEIAAAAAAEKLAAQNARLAAELARDASFVTGPKHPDEPTGRTAVADGVNFLVQGSGDVAAYEYRRVSAGVVSTLIATYPSNQAVLNGTHLVYSASDLTIFGTFIHKDTGIATSSASFNCSDFLEIIPGTAYAVQSKTAGNGAHAWFDARKAFISAFGLDQNRATVQLTSPANAKYVRFSQIVAYPFSVASVLADYNIRRLRDIYSIHLLPTPLASGLSSAYKIAILSDSTGRGVYSGDAQIGITGSTITRHANSWGTWASVFAWQRLRKTINASIIGNTIAQMDARVAADIIGAAGAPAACIVISGYNDAFADVSVATYMASIASIVDKLRSAGIVPILGTPLPTANNAAISTRLAEYASAVRSYAALSGLCCLDFHSIARDAATGGLLAAIAAGGDGVHPGIGGQKILGQYVASALSAVIPAVKPPLVTSTDEAVSLTPNPLFTGTPVGGRAPSVFVYGALPAGVATSITTDPSVPGNLQRITHTGSTAVATLAQRIQMAGKLSPGDVIAFSGRLSLSGVAAAVELVYSVSLYGSAPIALNADVKNGVFYGEFTVPVGASGYVDVTMISGPGTGTCDFGQLTAYNLTQLELL